MAPKRLVSKKPTPKSRAKSTPVISLTGMPPQAKQAWWSQRFIEVLESFRLGSRLARGKAYAQEAKVMKLSISSGVVTSTVQGSRKAHYKIAIKLSPLSDNAWRQVMNNLTRKAIFAVELLQDKMPLDIEEVFQSANVSLFPASLEEIESSCDCPDWSNPCKHIAATYYVLAQHFDLDPFLIFVWRGRLKTQILEFLRSYWRQGKPKSSALGARQVGVITPEGYERYWRDGQDLAPQASLDPFSKASPTSNIKRLGEAPVQLDETNLADALAEYYTHASDCVRAWAYRQDDKTKARAV